MIAALALCALAQVASPAVEREWSIRRWALAPPESLAELEGALASADWRARLAALDALGRGLFAWVETPLAERVGELAGAALDDGHPNVRAAALAVLARAPDPPAIARARLAELARDVLPVVRLQVAALAGAHAPAGAAELLAELARDADPRVAAEATVHLFAVADRSAAADLAREALFVELLARDDDADALRALAWLERAPSSPRLLARLALELASPAWQQSPRAARAWLALLEALTFAHTGAGDARRLLDGWFAAPFAPLRRDVLAACARSHDPALARALVEAVADLESLAFGAGDEERVKDRWPGLWADLYGRGRRTSESLAFELFECALDCSGPAAVLRHGLEVELPPPLQVVLLDQAGRRARRFELDVARAWLARGRPSAARLATVQALYGTLVHRGDRDAAPALVEALGDPSPSVRLAAFRALCDAPAPEAFGPALRAHYAASDPDLRAELLAELPRGVALASFQDLLLELGERPDERRPAVELLESFGGDERVHAALARWLDDDLERLAGARDARWRHAELRVMALVRALWRVAENAAIPSVVRALDASLGVSSDVGKTAAGALARTDAGRAVLRGYLGPAVDRRTRIECAIALAAERYAPAVAALIDDHPFAAWDLQSRMLAALSQSGAPEAVAFLVARARDAGEPSEKRQEAVAALAAVGVTPGVLAALEEVARGGLDLDTRLAALRTLGVLGGAEAAARLDALWDLLAQGDGAQAASPPSAAGGLHASELELLREGLLVALGKSGHFPAGREAECLRRPLADAAASLEQRFRRESGPAVEFRWRGELTLGGELARAGRLCHALDAAGPWWRADARFLLALSIAAAEAPGEPARADALCLARAALVAVEGEAERDAALVARARFHLLGLLERAGARVSFALLADDLLADWRARRLSDGVFADAFERFERQERDPPARLASAGRQARAFAALERGDVERARALAREAAELLGDSTRARAVQAELEAALGL